MTSETSDIFNSLNMQMGMLDEHVEAQLFTTHIGDYTAAGRDAEPTAANNEADNTKEEVDKEEEEEEQQRRIDKEIELDRPITIIVRHDDAEGELTYFKMRKRSQIIKLFLKFSERESIPLSSLCFFLNNGRRIIAYDIESTALTYGLEEEDIIDVRLRTEAEKQSKQIISEFMSFMKFPPEMNVNDGMNLVQLLYEIGKIPDWIATFDRGRRDYKYGFSEHCFASGFSKSITIDRETGRITHLGLWRQVAFSLPSIIGRFKGLSSMYLVNCCLLPMELGNLPLLESIKFIYCPPDMFKNIPDGLRLPSLKIVGINGSEFGSFLSPLLRIFPSTLELLSCSRLTKEESDKIIHSLQNDDLSFR
jgi:hypothetical protein